MTKEEQQVYWVWGAMIQRCHNPKNKHYHNYGARGVHVSSEWRDFNRFRADMGDRPAGYTIDRLDNSKGYSAENCKWVPRQVNNENKRIYKGNPFGISGVEPVQDNPVKYRVRVRHKGKIVLVKTLTDFFEACCLRISTINKLKTT